MTTLLKIVAAVVSGESHTTILVISFVPGLQPSDWAHQMARVLLCAPLSFKNGVISADILMEALVLPFIALAQHNTKLALNPSSSQNKESHLRQRIAETLQACWYHCLRVCLMDEATYLDVHSPIHSKDGTTPCLEAVKRTEFLQEMHKAKIPEVCPGLISFYIVYIPNSHKRGIYPDEHRRNFSSPLISSILNESTTP